MAPCGNKGNKLTSPDSESATAWAGSAGSVVACTAEFPADDIAARPRLQAAEVEPESASREKARRINRPGATASGDKKAMADRFDETAVQTETHSVIAQNRRLVQSLFSKICGDFAKRCKADKECPRRNT